MHRVELKGSKHTTISVKDKAQFLMHRVELKASLVNFSSNASKKFLMHRVELKGKLISVSIFGRTLSFLMHRVELKGGSNSTNKAVRSPSS
jgi:hypothetical protein